MKTKTKERTHAGECVSCWKRIPEERLLEDPNELFCSETCERFAYGRMNVPTGKKLKVVHTYNPGLCLLSNRGEQRFLQRVRIVDLE